MSAAPVLQVNVASVLDEVVTLRQRVKDLKRTVGMLDRECSQVVAEHKLVRAECIRQRERADQLANFIEDAHENADEEIPEDIADLIKARFPDDREALMLVMTREEQRLTAGIMAIAGTKLTGVEYGDFVQQACEDLLAGDEVECADEAESEAESRIEVPRS